MTAKENKAFAPGEVVTWTHTSPHGSTVTMTTREGKIIKQSEEKPDCYYVKFRGKAILIHKTHLRGFGQRSTLTEFVMGREKGKQGA